MQIKAPLRFWNDRNERGLDMPKALKFGKNYVLVDLDDEVMKDYLDDADYYKDIVSMSGERELLGIQMSARATIKAIKNWGL